jgi:threonine aldolase
VRKVFGGGMRQAGFLAATAIYALDHHIERLAIDHRHAKLIEAVLQKHPLVKMVLPVETNLIIFEMHERADPRRFIAQMKEKQILLLPISENRLRMVTHLDITAEMVEVVVTALSQIR